MRSRAGRGLFRLGDHVRVLPRAGPLRRDGRAAPRGQRRRCACTTRARHRPPPARRQVEDVQAMELQPGDEMLVRTGEIFAADGIVAEDVEGRIDESMLTGESTAIPKQRGAQVRAGTQNLGVPLRIASRQSRARPCCPASSLCSSARRPSGRNSRGPRIVRPPGSSAASSWAPRSCSPCGGSSIRRRPCPRPSRCWSSRAPAPCRWRRPPCWPPRLPTWRSAASWLRTRMHSRRWPAPLTCSGTRPARSRAV
jgi:hypothetical protein